VSTEQIKAIKRQEYEAVNQKKLDALEEVVAPDVISHPARPGQAPGLEGVKQLFSSLYAAFPDFHIDVEDMIAEGDRIVARVTGSGTHQGEFMGIAPTGNRVEFSAIDIARIVEGKIVEHWSNSDQLGLIQQLGVAEQPSR
jgi:predicted ester cyclase